MAHSSNSNDIINEARARFVVENDSKNKSTAENDSRVTSQLIQSDRFQIYTSCLLLRFVTTKILVF